ncbi:MAG: metal ABC transporter permease [Sulfurimonas sp.]|jgi:zinc/manganese transport system permease protein|nr:metal ABC transporter permease [Sulfurimonadaceae bacterium]
MIDILFYAIFLVVVLVMLHSYFGLEILRRGIIFTDLAIAQAAALGVAISLGYFHGEYSYVSSLAFALFCAILIAYGSSKKINLEAFIGILYVLSASAIMIVLAHSSEGMEYFKALLASDILFTLPSDIVKSTIIYIFVALAMFYIYPKVSGFKKELLFFSLLAITVTSSVALAGVFVVFTLLVAPPFVMLSLRVKKPLFYSFLFGWFFSITAIVVSFLLDLPTGYSIVFLGAFLSAVIVLVGHKDELSR